MAMGLESEVRKRIPHGFREMPGLHNFFMVFP
jgi:hypothetical protein